MISDGDLRYLQEAALIGAPPCLAPRLLYNQEMLEPQPSRDSSSAKRVLGVSVEQQIQELTRAGRYGGGEAVLALATQISKDTPAGQIALHHMLEWVGSDSDTDSDFKAIQVIGMSLMISDRSNRVRLIEELAPIGNDRLHPHRKGRLAHIINDYERNNTRADVFLHEQLLSGDPSVADKAIVAIDFRIAKFQTRGDHASVGECLKEFIPELIDLIADQRDQYVQWDAARFIIFLNRWIASSPEQTVKALIEIAPEDSFQGPGMSLRERVVHSLFGRYIDGNTEEVSRELVALASGYGPGAEFALDVLAVRGSWSVRAICEAMAESENEELQRKFAGILPFCGQEAAEEIVDFMDSNRDNPSALFPALDGLTRIQLSTAVPGLKKEQRLAIEEALAGPKLRGILNACKSSENEALVEAAEQFEVMRNFF